MSLILPGGGFRILVVDASELFHPRLDNETTTDLGLESVEVRRLTRWQALNDLRTEVSEARLSLLLVHSSRLSWQTYRLLRCFKGFSFRYLLIAPTVIPLAPPTEASGRPFEFIADLVGRFMRMELKTAIVARMPRRYLGVSAARYIVHTCGACDGFNQLVSSETTPILAHTYDYDLIRPTLREPTMPGSSDTAVFIDQSLHSHPDIPTANLNLSLNVAHYYARLSVLFDKVEEALGLNVKIALHPRADLDESRRLYGNRPVQHGNTKEMINDCQLVIAHHSAAIGIAVALGKAILLITFKELFETTQFHRSLYYGLSKELGIPFIRFENIDTMYLEGLPAVDHEKYNSYVLNYLKHPLSPDRDLWQIVEERALA